MRKIDEIEKFWCHNIALNGQSRDMYWLVQRIRRLEHVIGEYAGDDVAQGMWVTDQHRHEWEELDLMQMVDNFRQVLKEDSDVQT